MAEHKLDPNKLNPNVLFLRQVGITSILWAATFVASKADWARHPPSMPLRLALVIGGVGGLLPVVFVYAKSIRIQDEFNQRIHLVALSIAFAATAALSYAIDLLHQADFIPQLPATGLWAVMIGIWFVAMLLTPRYYR